MEPITVTLDTSHLEISALKDVASPNIECMLVTLDTSHFERSALNAFASVNIAIMLVTLDIRVRVRIRV